MMRAPVPIIALAAVLFISGCVGNGELPEDLEEYSMGYDMHIDLPRDWVKTEWEWLPSGESSMECYPSERNRNPDIEIHIYYPDTKALGDFVEWQLRDEPVDEFSDYTFPEIIGKRVAQRDDRYEYVRFYFQIEETESYSETLYLYGRLSFRRDVSSFGDADWDRFIDRVAGSLEFKD